MEEKLIDEQIQTDTKLCVSEKGKADLKIGRGWALFLAIMGFIFIGFMIIAGIGMTIASVFAGASTDMPFSFAWFGLIYFIFAGIHFIPVFFLYRFTSSLQSALQNDNNAELNLSFQNLKMLFKSSGILLIVGIALYFLMIIGFLIFGLSQASSLF
ncbi:MAG: hypothetical protein MI922_00375 [Bacteroidales bacterium]|nr:hypothetical protein [Bacteroidales bacterium]